jgi:electron transfer flavoprotein alpha subunit
LTDGLWGNQESEKDAASALAKKYKTQIVAIGISAADKDFLQKIATNKEFAFKTDISSLSTSFSGIARAINESSRSLR